MPAVAPGKEPHRSCGRFAGSGFGRSLSALSLETLMSEQVPDEPTRSNQTRARQGVTGHNVRYVLSVGIGLAILAGVVLYFTVGR